MENKYKAMAKEYFEQKNLKYNDLDDNLMSLAFTLDNIKDLHIFVVFEDEEDSRPYFLSKGIVTFPEEKTLNALLLVNKLNNQFRWAKFHLDDEGDIIVRMDAIVSDESAGEEIWELIGRMSGIIDAAYPEMMKVRFA